MPLPCRRYQCEYKLIQSDCQTLLSQRSDISLTFHRELKNVTIDTMKEAYGAASSKARVIVTCGESLDYRRLALLAVVDAGLDTDEFVFVFLETSRAGFGNDFLT